MWGVGKIPAIFCEALRESESPTGREVSGLEQERSLLRVTIRSESRASQYPRKKGIE